MNKTSIYYFSLAAIAIGSFASCQDYDAGFSEDEIYANDYKSAFEEAFGEIDPNQNWGFEPMPIGGVDYGGTRTVNVNSNEWETIFHYKVPGPRGGEADGNTLPWGWAAGDVTNYERAYVYWWFSTHPWPKTLVVNWNSFFIENVWGQPEHSGSNVESSADFRGEELGMDYLSILKATGTKKSPSPSDGTYINSYAIAQNYKFDNDATNYEHISDFNTGGGAHEQVMYIYDVSTMDFSFQASQQDEQKTHNNWTIQQINGNYYLAFDYWHAKNSEASHFVEADGFYNDWILKLSNGEHQEDYYTRRIMCEDLGNTFDWDWNDVVFDVTTYTLGGKYYAMITLQAAGGTLPIYVGDENHEAHAMFGVSTDTPVNVNAPGNQKRPAVVYSIELTNDQLVDINGKKYCRAENIPVYVPSRSNPAILVTLDAEQGKAPQKFACSSSTYWMQELTHIDKGHKFTKWVEQRSNDQQAWVQLEDQYMRHFSESKPLTDAEKEFLYEDLGKPTAVSYYPNQGNTSVTSNSTFVEWRTLWNSMVAEGGLNNSDFTCARKWTIKDGDNVDRSFITQAPNIYETVNADDDPIAFTINAWSQIEGKTYSDSKGTVGPFEQVWPVITTYTISLTAGAGGSVSGAGTYREGASVTITAIPDFGYEFTQWSDGNTNSTRTFTASSDANLTATFTNAYTVEVADINTTNNSEIFTTLANNNYDLLTTFSPSLAVNDKCIIQVYVSEASNVTIAYAENGSQATGFSKDASVWNLQPNQPGYFTIPLIVDYLKITQGQDKINRIVIKKKSTE